MLCRANPSSNAWAIAGMTRVLTTLFRWTPPPDSIDGSLYVDFQQHYTAELTQLLQNMLNCLIAQDRDPKSGLIKNYLDGEGHRSSAWAYGDAAGTSMVTSAVYRLAVLLPDIFDLPEYTIWADMNAKAVAEHVHPDGRVGPVALVTSVPSKSPSNHTSEGQSMAILLNAAHRDYQQSRVWSKINRHLPWL
jgi:hypothetical protein